MEKAALAGYPQVARMIYERPWAILPQTLAVIEEVVRHRIDGQRFTEDEIAERLADARRDEARADDAALVSFGAGLNGQVIRAMGGGKWAAFGAAPLGTPGALAVIPIHGVLMPKANLMSAMSGGTSYQQLQSQLREALASPDVAGILLDVDSPGGSVDLLRETADMVYAARDAKPIIAFVNPEAGSAAYYIAAQAEEVYTTPSGQTGSIGTLAIHTSIAGALAQAGVEKTVIAVPEFKDELSPYSPLAAETIDYMRVEINAVYGEFVDAVARGRNANPETVREDMGRGRMLRADDALAAGMVDGVATFDQAVVRLAQMTRGARGRVALAEFNGALRYGAVKPGDGKLHEDAPKAKRSITVEILSDTSKFHKALDEALDEIPDPQVADGDDGGKPAARARLRGRRI